MKPGRAKGCARSSAPASVCALATLHRPVPGRRSVSHQMVQATVALLSRDRIGSGCVASLTEDLSRLVPYFDRMMLRILAQHLERRLWRVAIAAALDDLDGGDQAGLVQQISAVGSHVATPPSGVGASTDGGLMRTREITRIPPHARRKVGAPTGETTQ